MYHLKESTIDLSGNHRYLRRGTGQEAEVYLEFAFAKEGTMKIERIQYPNNHLLPSGQLAKKRSEGSSTDTSDAVDFDGEKQKEKRQWKERHTDGGDNPARFDSASSARASTTASSSGIDVVV